MPTVSPAPTEGASIFVPRVTAQQILGVTTPKLVAELVAAGRLRVRHLPGAHARYSLSDLQRIAAEAMQPTPASA